MIKGLIFDLDGTLIDTIPDFIIICRFFLQDLNLPCADEEVIKKAIGKGARVTMDKLLAMNNYGIKNKEHFDDLFNHFMHIYNNHNKLQSRLWNNVFATLTILRQQGYKMAVCTNKPHKPTILNLRHHKIYDFFDIIVDAESTPYLKPDIRIVQYIAKDMSLSVSDFAFIGDSCVDIQTARNANIPSVLVSYGYETQDLKSLGANLIIDDFSKLICGIRQL